MKKLKILLVINVRWYNAEADYCLNLANGLDSTGMDVTVMGLQNSPVIKKADECGLKTVTHIDINTQNPVGILINSLVLKMFLKREKFDIVNFHRSEGFFTGAYASKGVGAKVVRTRGDMRPVRQGVFNRLLYNGLADFIITSGDIIKESLIERLDTSPDKIATIYTAVDTDFFTPQKRSDKLKKELALNGEMKIVAILGRLGDIKGHGLFVRAARLVRHRFKDVKFLIIGKDVDNECANLHKLIIDRGLKDDVRFMLGMRPDIDEIVADVDIGVVTSTGSEANCRVAEEWMSAGVPIVAFATGVIPEVVTDGSDGYLVSTGDHEALAEKIIALLEDSALRGSFSKTARENALEKFNLERLVTSTLEIYNRLVSD